MPETLDEILAEMERVNREAIAASERRDWYAVGRITGEWLAVRIVRDRLSRSPVPT